MRSLSIVAFAAVLGPSLVLAACATVASPERDTLTGDGDLDGALLELGAEARRTPAGDAVLARLGEAVGADYEAVGHWLGAAERAPALRRWAEVRLIDLIDRLEQGPMPEEWLARARRLPELAEFSERLALALDRADALAAAREVLGTSFAWRRTKRLLRYPGNTSSPALRGEGFDETRFESSAGFIASPEHGPGLYAFDLALPRGRWHIDVLGDCAVEAFVAGRAVASHPALDQLRSERMRFSVDLTADESLELHLVSRAAVARARVLVRAATAAGASLDAPKGPLGALARFEIALADRDVEAAHDLLAELPAEALLTWLGRARLAILDPTRAPERARTGAKTLLAAALEREPAFAEARALLVQLHADDQELDDARRALGASPPHHLVVLAAAIDPPRAALAAEAALHLAPHSCRHRNAWLDLGWEQLRYHPADVTTVFRAALAPLPGPCLDATFRAVDLLREGAHLDAAAALLAPALAGLDPGPDRARAETLGAQLALAGGAWDVAAAHAERALSQGGSDAFARELLQRARRLQGAAPVPRLDPEADLGLPLTAARPLILKHLRHTATDGRETLLDDRHVRVYPDGALRVRVHRIVRVNDVAAVESVGELPVPDDAEILFVRTWKHDRGVLRPLEPEDILEKATVSLPNLAPGDFAEWAWFYPLAPEPRLMPGWRAPAYAFDSDDGPVAHARYAVSLAPGARPPVFVVDRRVPPPSRPDATTWVFEARDLARVFSEPLDPRPELRRMTLGASSGVEWLPLGDALGAEIAFATRPSPTLAATLAEVLRGLSPGGGQADPEALLAALYRHVQEKIEEPDEASPFGVEASWIAERGRGSRALLLTALCREAGLLCELVLARPLWEGPEPAHAELDGMTYPLVRWAPLGKAPLWLDPTSRWMPLGLLPPALEGRFGIALGTPAARAETALPERDGDPTHWGERKVDVRFAVERGAIAVVADGTETLDGVFGSSWRTALTGMAADRRKDVLGAIVQQALPAATIESVAIEHLEDADRPLVITWRARTATTPVDSASERGSRALSIALFPENLTNDTVVLPTRTTPLLVNRAARMTLRLSAIAPDGHVFSLAPSDQKLVYDLGHFERASRFEDLGRRVVVDKRFLLRPGVIDPSRYAAWSEAAVAIDRFDLVQLILTPQRSPRTPL